MERRVENKKKTGSFFKSILTIFKHADNIDRLLMVFGFIGAIGDGLAVPVMFFITSKAMNNLGDGNSSHSLSIHRINKVRDSEIF